jgi:hypothetical protein
MGHPTNFFRVPKQVLKLERSVSALQVYYHSLSLFFKRGIGRNFELKQNMPCRLETPFKNCPQGLKVYLHSPTHSPTYISEFVPYRMNLSNPTRDVARQK